MLIAIEAIDGSGKTALRRRLYQRFSAAGIPALTVNQVSWLAPRSARVISRARYLAVATDPKELLHAYVDDKLIAKEKLLEPQLAVGSVIADRYVASDRAFLAALWGVPLEVSEQAYLAAGVRMPDVTIFLDKPRERVIDRLLSKATGEREWWQTAQAMERLWESFQEIFAAGTRTQGGAIVRLDATAPPDDLLGSLDESLVPYLALARSEHPHEVKDR